MRFATSTVAGLSQPIDPLQHSPYGQLIQPPLNRKMVICKGHILTIPDPFTAAGVLCHRMKVLPLVDGHPQSFELRLVIAASQQQGTLFTLCP